jgi:hypothetical protein
MQYVEKKFMKVDYNMLVQNHVYYNVLCKTNHLWGGGVMVKDLTLQCQDEKFKSSHLQPRLPFAIYVI